MYYNGHMSIILSLLATMISVGISAYLLPGVSVTGWGPLFWTAVVMGLVNAILKPILKILTFPISILTLGLFSVVLNVLLIMLVDYFVSGFTIDGFIWAVIFSVVLSVVSSVVGTVVKG